MCRQSIRGCIRRASKMEIFASQKLPVSLLLFGFRTNLKGEKSKEKFPRLFQFIWRQTKRQDLQLSCLVGLLWGSSVFPPFLPFFFILTPSIIIYIIDTFSHKHSWKVFSKQKLFSLKVLKPKHFKKARTLASFFFFFLLWDDISGFGQCFSYDDHIFCWQEVPPA